MPVVLVIQRFPFWLLDILKAKGMLVCYLFLVVFTDGFFCEDAYKGGVHMNSYGALVNITYKDPVTGELISTKKEIGRYGTASRLDSEWGWVVHVRTEDNKTHGCTPPINVPKTKDKWVALVERGSCKFHKKIQNAAMVKNASAVVIYNHRDGDLLTMDHSVNEPDLLLSHHTTHDQQVHDVVSIFITKAEGEKIAQLVDNGTRVMMHISVGRHLPGYHSTINKTSVLFVSISFIVLMIISLAWLVFYYIQRFRYAHAKERLSKRLMNAAKKAITKMPLRTLKNGDQETESDFDQCAVCIESYKPSDVIRILPCKHMFHKSCVDPWLIEQRSCPMCKLDILKAYGLQIHGSRDSVVNIDIEGPSTSYGPSELIPPDSLRDVESDVLEVIRYQPAHVEYHEVPSSIEAEHADAPARSTPSPPPEAEEQGEEAPTTPLKPAASLESVHSTEWDSNELQSLMSPNSDTAASPPSDQISS